MITTYWLLLIVMLLRLRISNSFIVRNCISSVTRSFQSTASCLQDVQVNEGNSIPEKYQSSFLQTLSDRGFIHQCTDYRTLDTEFSGQKVVSAYLGFDATASSLHVGSLLQIMLLRTLQKHGHRPVILIGGGTTRIGDPSGKDESRQLLSNEAIQQNMEGISKVFHKFLKFGNGPTDAIMVNNADWLNCKCN